MKKKVYNFKNDVLFKYALSDEKDPNSQYLLRIIIEGYLHIKCKSIRVLNPELNPQNYDDKEMIIDIEVELEDGNIIDIEMQNSLLTVMLIKRFQIYGAEILARQLKPGENYLNANHVYQIIFIYDRKKDYLVDVYTFKNQEGMEEMGNIMTRLYVYLPCINDLKQEKTLSEFNEVELATYIFKNGFDDDIMKMQSRVVDIMKEKQDRFNEDEQMRALAYKSELARLTRIGEQQESYDNGVKVGKEQEKYANVLKYFKRYYQVEDTRFLESLNIEQYDEILEMIFDRMPLEKIIQKAKE